MSQKEFWLVAVPVNIPFTTIRNLRGNEVDQNISRVSDDAQLDGVRVIFFVIFFIVVPIPAFDHKIRTAE